MGQNFVGQDVAGAKSPLLVIREGRLSLFGSHGKGTGPRVSHCGARVPVEVKNFLSQKIFLSSGSAGFPVSS